MNTDLNGKIQGKLNQNRKNRNMKKALLVLSLAAVIFTSTVLANPASALTEDVSGGVVQGLENGGDSGSGAQAPAQAADEQADAQGNEAAPSSDPQKTVAAPSADQGVMNANSVSAVDSAAVTEKGTGDSGITVSGAEADETEKSAGQISAAEGSGTAESAVSDTSGSETAEQGATLAEAAETVSTEEAAADKTTEKTEQTAQNETDVLSFADDRAQVKIARKDGTGFPSDTTMSGSPLGTDDWNRVLSAVSSKVKAQSDDSAAYSVAGLHTWTLSLQAGDGSAASYDDIRAEAKFQGGLNDAGYATKTSEKEENGTDGTSITTTSYETSWRVYAISGDSIADPVEDHLTDLTDADGTSLSVDENGALQSAAFDGSLPETVVFAQIVRETVTTGTEKKKEIPMPAVNFDREVATDHGTIMVHVEADEGTFEQGTTMSVEKVSSEDILDKAIEAAGGRGSAAAVDISFRKADGTETEPAKAIRVKMTAKVLGQADKAHVVHVDDTGNTDVVAKKSDGKTIESTSNEAASSDAKNAVSFKSDSFSVYAIVYTVDFTFSGYTYSIKGGSSIRLSSLAKKLGLHDTKQNKDFAIDDVDDVTFSNSSLVEVAKKDGDWELVSKKPFTSTEKLTISMKDGSKYEVEVKDEQDEQDEQEVDLGKYIKSVDTYKYNNEKWVETSSIQDGDNVKFQLNFSVNSGELSQGQKLTYTMDNHITIGKATSGPLSQGTTQVGTVNVDTDGKVTISLNASFDSTKAFEGEVNFEGTVHNSDSSKSITVNFGEEATISIQPKSTSNNYDVSTAKTGSYQTDSNGNHYIQYEVTISTTKGTGGAIKFTDSMSANGIAVPSYDLEQVSVYKNGTSESVKVKPVISEGKMEIDNLPELKANENYHVIYRVPVNGEITSADGSASIYNKCHAWNNNVNGWGETTTKIQDAVIKKTGYYDSNSGKLKWTITVNNPEHKNLSGAVLKDILSVTDGDGANVKLPENFTIKGSDRSEFSGSFDADGSYTFPSGSYTADKYTIEYETTAPTGTAGTTSKVKNTITYQEGEKDYHTDSGDINVYHPTYGVSKSAPTSQGQTDAGEKLEWTVRVDLPDGELDLTKLTYTDTMTTWNKTSEITGKHFITPALLNEASVWSDRGTLVAGTDYQLQKLDGSNITGNNSTEQLAGFRIQFFEAARIKLEGQKSFSLRYDTIADEQDQPAGSTWTYKNKAAIPDHESEASYDYKKPEGDLVKQVSLTDETSSYSSDAPQIEYSEKGMTLYYKVLIRLSKDSSGDQTIVDVLPSGMDFGKLNRVVYFDDIWNQYDDLNHYTGGSSFNLKDHVVVNSEQQADGTTKTTFTLSDGYERPNTDSYCIAFYYTATINDAQFWGDLHNTEKEYTNQAVWGNLNAGVTTKVRHTIKNLDKIAQLSDVEGKDGGVKKAAYYLTINPLGSDLVPTKDTITLKDQLSCDEADVQIQFKPESLKVFAYDGSKENHCGDEINQNRYGFSYNEQQHSMELKLPDETPCVVYYEYYVVPGMNKAGLSNSASLSGIANSSSDNRLSLSASTAAGSVSRDELTIYKVDSDNYRIKLKGVTFELYQYQFDNNKPSWAKVDSATMKDSLTTDQDGKLYLNRIDDKLKQDCLYKLIETSVGTNTTYQFDKDKAYYFIWASKDDESKNDQQIWNAISGYDHSEVKQEEVNIIRHSGTIYVPNENTGITINKVWLNADHTDDKNPGKAEVTLYRQAKQPGGVKVTVNVKDPWDKVYYQNEIYIKSGTSVSMLIDTDWEETYSVDGRIEQFRDGQDHTLELGSPSKNTTYNVVASYWKTQKVKELYYTPTDQYTNIGDQVKINTYTLSSENNYSVTVGNLPFKDDSGNKYYYRVEEKGVPHYTTSYSDNNGKIQKGTITVTNTRESATVSGLKAWKNADGTSDPPAGASCVFELYKDGTATGNRITLDGTEDDREKLAWTAVFSNLEKYNTDGNEIQYTVREVQSPEGYAPDKTEIESGETITNSQEQRLEFTKIWRDGTQNIGWPQDTTINVSLHRELRNTQGGVLTDSGVVATYELNGNSVVTKIPENAPACTPSEKDGKYTYVISGLPSAGRETKDGKTISGTWHYYITEDRANGYQEPQYRALNQDGTVITGNALSYAENGQAIINQKDSSYTLPSTGGHGTLPLTGAGALVLLLAGTALTVRKLLIQRNTGKGGGSE